MACTTVGYFVIYLIFNVQVTTHIGAADSRERIVIKGFHEFLKLATLYIGLEGA